MMIAHPPVPPHEHPHSSWVVEDDELADICDHVQSHSSLFVELPPPEAPATAAPVTLPNPEKTTAAVKVKASSSTTAPPPLPASLQQQREEEEEETIVFSRDEDDEPDEIDNTPLSEDLARLCAIKREAILLLSAAHKSTSGADRIRAMTLLAALYKAETKHDLTVLGEKVQELLQKKREQDAELERIRAEEEANRIIPERFSRIRASVNRMMHHNSDNRSVASQPSPHPRRTSSRQGPGWRFFWQRDGDSRRRLSHDGIHGFQVPAIHANRNARLQSLTERKKVWDTRTV